MSFKLIKASQYSSRYGFWPFQFSLTLGSSKNGRTSKSNENLPTQVYQCFLNVAELLIPGSEFNTNT